MKLLYSQHINSDFNNIGYYKTFLKTNSGSVGFNYHPLKLTDLAEYTIFILDKNGKLSNKNGYALKHCSISRTCFGDDDFGETYQYDIEISFFENNICIGYLCGHLPMYPSDNSIIFKSIKDWKNI